MNMKTHTMNSSFYYGCYFCPLTFLLKQDLIKHERTHTRDHFECYFCPQDFLYELSHQKHEQTHVKENPSGKNGGTKRFKCDICPSEYYKKSHLKGHKLTQSGVKSRAAIRWIIKD